MASQIQKGSQTRLARTDSKRHLGAVWEGFVARMDGWINTFTGLGTRQMDKLMRGYHGAVAVLDDDELASLYNGDDLAARIVDALPEEALGGGYEVLVEADDDDTESHNIGHDVEVFLEDELCASERLIEAWAWGRLFGGGAVYMVTNDNITEQHEPLNLDALKSLDALTVLDKRDLYPKRYYSDPSSKKYGQVETYQVAVSTNVGTETNPNPLLNVEIHESRLIMFGGVRTTIRERNSNSGWDYSVIQRIYDVLRQYGSNWQALSNMLQSASQGVFKMDGLIDMIAGGEIETVQTRMSLVDMQRSVARSLMIDADKESYDQIETKFASVPDALRVFLLRVASAARMPLTVLMGMSPAGMNATGESDLRIWAKQVQLEQSRVLRPRLARLIEVAMNADEGPTNGNEPPDWKVVFPPVIEMTEKEDAEIQKLTADTDKLYVDAGVLLPEEIAVNRFTAKGFSRHTIIDLEDRRQMLAQDEPEPLEPEPAPPTGPEPASEPTAGDPEAVDPSTALNGAQVQSMLAIVDKVVLGEYDKSTAAKIMAASFPMSEAEAARILADVQEPEDEPQPPTELTPPEPPDPNAPPVPPEPAPQVPPADDNAPPTEEELQGTQDAANLLVWRADRIEENGPESAPYCVVAENGERIACHASRASAVRQLRAIEQAKSQRQDQLTYPFHTHDSAMGTTMVASGIWHAHILPDGSLTGFSKAGPAHTHEIPGGERTSRPKAASSGDRYGTSKINADT